MLIVEVFQLNIENAVLFLIKIIMITIDDRFAELKWLLLKTRINFNIAIQVYKCINGLSNQGLEKLFTHSKNIHTHNTRSASKMNLHSNQYYYKSFSSIGIITVWNIEIRSANSLSKFKQYLFSYHILPTKLVYS